jgi:para-aminobenzoate synthetase component I
MTQNDSQFQSVLVNEALAPWFWRSQPLAHRSGAEIFERLFGTEAIATILESPENTEVGRLEHSRYSICAGGPRILQGEPQLWTPARGSIFSFLESLVRRISDGCQQSMDLSQPPSHLPFQGGWLGWLSYGVGREIETLPELNPDPLPFPHAYWYEPESFAVLDHQEQTLWLASSAPDSLTTLIEQLTRPIHKTPSQSPVDPNEIAFETTQSDYIQRVEKAKEYITQGDIFQTNLSLRFSTQSTRSPWEIYQNLHRINPSPFASFWKTPWGGIISCSPERLVQLQGRKAQTRPIAGTRPRDNNARNNQQWEQELKSNRKELAEHIMLVDLERNDLGRVCEWGSVQVNELCVIEPYSHVIHLVSNVIGTLDATKSPIDLIQATFPGGTITGCPKVRCMEIIEELEPVQRSLFYGSCGFLDYRGNLDLNILIRTLLYSQPLPKHRRTFWGQVGAGIVADSDPEKEWFESLQKAKALLAVL